MWASVSPVSSPGHSLSTLLLPPTNSLEAKPQDGSHAADLVFAVGGLEEEEAIFRKLWPRPCSSVQRLCEGPGLGLRTALLLPGFSSSGFLRGEQLRGENSPSRQPTAFLSTTWGVSRAPPPHRAHTPRAPGRSRSREAPRRRPPGWTPRGPGPSVVSVSAQAQGSGQDTLWGRSEDTGNGSPGGLHPPKPAHPQSFAHCGWRGLPPGDVQRAPTACLHLQGPGHPGEPPPRGVHAPTPPSPALSCTPHTAASLCFLHPLTAPWHQVYLEQHEGWTQVQGTHLGLNTGSLTSWGMLSK